ncbi:MAG: hypothetical protein ACREBN_03195 [Burkholderiaceae bacterium]
MNLSVKSSPVVLGLSLVAVACASAAYLLLLQPVQAQPAAAMQAPPACKCTFTLFEGKLGMGNCLCGTAQCVFIAREHSKGEDSPNLVCMK